MFVWFKKKEHMRKRSYQCDYGMDMEGFLGTPKGCAKGCLLEQAQSPAVLWKCTNEYRLGLAQGEVHSRSLPHNCFWFSSPNNYT